MTRRQRLRDSLIVAFNTVLLLALIEGGLRAGYFVRNSTIDVVLLPYTAAQDWGVIPPWADSLRILEPDHALLWRNRPGVERTYLDVFGPAHVEAERVALLQQFIPRVPESLRGNPVWNVSINAQGFRGAEFSREKPRDVFRIVCLGDSWTFGANVGQEFAYPQRLAAILRSRYPDASFEVLNLGVMGYSSRQGLELLRRRALELQPDLLLIGFAMNDAIVQGWRDKDAVGQSAPPARTGRRWAEYLESYKLARYWQQRWNRQSWTIGDYLQRVAKEDGTPDAIWTGRQASESADYAAIETIVRVSPPDFEANLRSMIDAARSRGAEVVLLYNDLWSTPYQAAVERTAGSAGVPWVNSKKMLDDIRAYAARVLEERLGLQPSGAGADPAAGPVQVVFRVHAGKWPVRKAFYIAGNHPSLGDGVPNRVALRDDGTAGDEKSGDGVWSYAATFDRGARIFYVYTNSGTEGRWEGLDVPELRFMTVSRDASSRHFRPIETFGSLSYQADGWHTNAAGLDLIAHSVADVLGVHARVREHLGRAAAASHQAVR